MITTKQLIQWHTDQGIAAQKRAASGSTKDCIKSNLDAATFHREVVEFLCEENETQVERIDRLIESAGATRKR